ncbi:hypothetical protein J1614_010748 [Plenodomus biglobosus]|nr:hypothetical protein J1614_010748 [Plenodomus biglobosus]
MTRRWLMSRRSVRIAPNELSFASVQALQDIYGHATKGKKPFLKGAFHVQAGEKYLNLVSERDPTAHANKKRLFTNAFSTKALSAQQDITKRYINLFLNYIEKNGGQSSLGVNLTQIYYWLTFDVIGDLSFGESFHALEDGKTSYWVDLLSDAMHLALFHHVTQRLPIAKLAVPFIMPRDAPAKLKVHKQLSREKMLKRVAMQDSIDREDFFSSILRKNADMPEQELINHAEILIIAGSETTANLLCGLTYHLLKNPKKLARLCDEVRSAFGTLVEITWDSTNDLPYLTAVIKEALRVFSPAPFGAQRVCPGAMVDGHFIPTGTLVSVAAWTTHYDPRYWSDPNEFKPERWLVENSSDVRAAFQPFSIGPRACIGVNLAYLEVRLTIASMILAYDWEWVNSDLNWEKECQHRTLWQIPPLKVRFQRRTSPAYHG